MNIGNICQRIGPFLVGVAVGCVIMLPFIIVCQTNRLVQKLDEVVDKIEQIEKQQ